MRSFNMTNNPGGIRWQDGTPTYNEQVKKMTELTKQEKIEQLVEWIVDAMDVSALESFVKENLKDYYDSQDGEDDFENNYANMKEIVGDE